MCVCVCRVQINQNAQRFMAKMANCFLNAFGPTHTHTHTRLKVITVEAQRLPEDGASASSSSTKTCIAFYVAEGRAHNAAAAAAVQP